MMRMAAAALLAAAWGGPAQGPERGVAADISQARALNREFVAGFNSGDLMRVMRSCWGRPRPADHTRFLALIRKEHSGLG